MQARCERLEPLQRRVEQLMAERAVLLQEAKQAQRVRTLFDSVTDKTRELQDAAASVIERVEATKHARRAEPGGICAKADAGGKLAHHQYEQGGRTPSAKVPSCTSPRHPLATRATPVRASGNAAARPKYARG